MIQNCKYDKKADILETVSGLQADVRAALETGTIVSSSSEASYNGQKDLAEVGTRISEPFDAIEYDRSYTRIRKEVNEAKEE